MRILVVEDEVFVALDLEQELRTRGHEVLGPASTLAEAHALVEETDLDLALLDVNVRGDMPRALAEELREREIPFAYVSGYDEAFIKTNLPSAPVLPKPLHAQALSDLLREVAA
ncbi:MAG: response regulator [Geminicoccaceae bacterium]|nr:response regulator [Geminicoccaceae bacterium]